jgi:hypothetical protein
LPSPRNDRLGPFKHLSADNMTWLQRSLIVAARFLAPCFFTGFRRPALPSGSLPPTGTCYRALRRLPGQHFHLLEERVLQDTPYLSFYVSAACVVLSPVSYRPATSSGDSFHTRSVLSVEFSRMFWPPTLSQL